MGNYGIVLSLLGCLDNGLRIKKLVDKVIDDCEELASSSLDFVLTLPRR